MREIPVVHTRSIRVGMARRAADGSRPDDAAAFVEGSFALDGIDPTVPLEALYRRSGVG